MNVQLLFPTNQSEQSFRIFHEKVCYAHDSMFNTLFIFKISLNASNKQSRSLHVQNHFHWVPFLPIVNEMSTHKIEATLLRNLSAVLNLKKRNPIVLPHTFSITKQTKKKKTTTSAHFPVIHPSLRETREYAKQKFLNPKKPSLHLPFTPDSDIIRTLSEHIFDTVEKLKPTMEEIEQKRKFLSQIEYIVKNTFYGLHSCC